MSSLCVCAQARFQQFKTWSATAEGQQAQQFAWTSAKQLAISLAIQSVAISVFAMSGSVTVVCTLTLAGFSVAALSYIPSLSERASNACKFLANFGVIHLVYELGLNTFIHEMGHALAGAALYGGRPTIQIDFLGGGQTMNPAGKLTVLGEFFGKERVRVLVAAAGPIASLVFAMGMFAWAAYQTDGTVAQRMNIQGAVQLTDELIHSYKSAMKRNLSIGNDYGTLHRLAGIHPAVSLTVLALLPAIQLIWINREAVKKNIEDISLFTASNLRNLSFNRKIFANYVV